MRCAAVHWIRGRSHDDGRLSTCRCGTWIADVRWEEVREGVRRRRRRVVVHFSRPRLCNSRARGGAVHQERAVSAECAASEDGGEDACPVREREMTASVCAAARRGLLPLRLLVASQR